MEEIKHCIYCGSKNIDRTNEGDFDYLYDPEYHCADCQNEFTIKE